MEPGALEADFGVGDAEIRRQTTKYTNYTKEDGGGRQED